MRVVRWSLNKLGHSHRLLLIAGTLATVASLSSCGGGGSSTGGSASSSGPSIVSVTVYGSAYTQAGHCSTFTATVTGTGSFVAAVQWYVNGVAGGSASDGMISSSGNYCAPAQPPASNPVAIKAVASADASKSGSAPTRVVEITLSPTQPQVHWGSTQQFGAAITGSVSNAVIWQVNGVAGGTSTDGTISTNGLYTAPTQPTTDAIAVEAVLAESSIISASANLLMFTQIVISPQSPQLTYANTQQFTAQINGAISQVSWAAQYGSITASGLYTAIGTVSPDTVRAFTPTANGSTTVEVVGLQPAITSISPQPATALDQITITGVNLNPIATVVFQDAIGGQIPVTGASVGTNSSGTSVTVTVPQGSISGPLYVLTAQGLLTPMRSNTLQFQRLARLRIRSPQQDLSAGESVTLEYALMGDSTPRAVTFSADVGSLSGATYFAPGTMANDGFVHISGCITGTNSCDTLILGLHPFRIAPQPPLVALGQSLSLSAVLGGGAAGASWTLLAGGGSLGSGGVYTAGTRTQDGGPALVSAVSSTATEQASVGVTGAFPGLVNRTFDYFDQHNPNASGSFVYGIAVIGDRLYMAGSNHVGAYTDSYFWIDVYDVSNPLEPVWLTAVESNSGGPLFTVGPYLYSYVNTDIAVPGYPNTVTLYAIQNGLPVLRARTQVPQWWNMTSNHGILTLIPTNGVSGTRDSQDILMYDLTSGTIASTDLSVPLPSNANSFLPDASIRIGNRLFMSIMQNDNLTGTILTYDLSASPAELIGSINGRSLAFYTSGNFLFGAAGGMDIYDISSVLPQFQSHMDGINAQELNGTQLLALTGQQGCRMLDISDPQSPKITATFFDGVIAGCNQGVLVGNYFYANEYTAGLVIYDASQSGGPVAGSRLSGGPHLTSYGYDLILRPPYLYAATTSGDGAALETYDTSTTPPTRLGEYFDDTQAGYAVAASGNYLYFGMGNNTGVFDLSQPASPVIVGQVPVPAISLATATKVLYAGTANNSLVVMGNSTPSRPLILETLALPDLPAKLRVVGNLLFIADSSAGLLIYDISNPTSPALIKRFTGFNFVADLTVFETTAFVAADVDGLGILDISNPAQPVLVSKTSLSSVDPFMNTSPPNQALSVTANNGIVYLGTLNDNGLVFGLDCTNLATPRIVSIYAHGDFIMTWVSSLVFNGNELFAGGFLGGDYSVAPVDMSEPFDTINQYFPPLALQNPAPVGSARSTTGHIRLGEHPAFRFAYPHH
jgi:hypothetical protein